MGIALRIAWFRGFVQSRKQGKTVEIANIAQMDSAQPEGKLGRQVLYRYASLQP